MGIAPMFVRRTAEATHIFKTLFDEFTKKSGHCQGISVNKTELRSSDFPFDRVLQKCLQFDPCMFAVSLG